MKPTTKNPQEFMIWLGNEFETVVLTNSDSFQRRKKLIEDALNLLGAMNAEEKAEVARAFQEFHRSGKVGDYVVRRDVRDEYDFAEEIIATLEGITHA